MPGSGEPGDPLTLVPERRGVLHAHVLDRQRPADGRAGPVLHLAHGRQCGRHERVSRPSGPHQRVTDA